MIDAGITIQMKHITDYSRFFSFGCSYTQYNWPTWADIVGHQSNYFENWGQSGAGNHFILNSVMECHQRNRINQDDLVIVMWTFPTREDRFVRGKWLTPGNVYQHREYDETFTRKFSDPVGYMINTCNYMRGVYELLDKTGCRFYFLSVVDYRTNPPGFDPVEGGITRRQVLDVYQDVINCVLPSVHEIIYNFDWHKPIYGKLVSYPHKLYPMNVPKSQTAPDNHPTPLQHMHYLESVVPELSLNNDTREFAQQWDHKLFNPTDDELKRMQNFTLYSSAKPRRFGV